MKKVSKLLSLFVALCMVLSLGAFASGEPSGAPSGEASAESTGIPATAETKDVADMTASEYEYLTNYTNRKTPGDIYIEYDETASGEIALDETVNGEGFTAVYAHGADADVTVTGTLVVLDDSDGQNCSDFSGQASATVVYDGAKLDIKDLTYYSEGFERGVLVISQNAIGIIEDSDITVMGNNALTNAWDGYHSSADQSFMISPPWCLGLYGGGRILNMIGANPTLVIKNSTLTGGETWGLLSTDSGSNMMIEVVDSTLASLPESKGGMDSGWRIFGYDEDAYGSAYGAYYIGNPSQYYYGATFDGVTYAGIITGGTTGHYASSNGDIEIKDANGNVLETVKGKGQPTVINGVFGIMQHNSLSDGLYIEDGTIVNTADAIIIQKAANGDYYFDDCELNSAKGVLFQMMDNDDDSRIGGNPMDVKTGFDEVYSDSKISTSGEGFPGIAFDNALKTGGNTVTATYTNGEYTGNIYNGTGYYGQSADNLVVTLGENAVLNGDIALTSTIKGVKYSPEAIEGIEYYGDDIQYLLLDANGMPIDSNASAEEPAFIQITDYTINEYFLQGHVENLPYFNGGSTIAVTVAKGAEWNVAGESLITSLTIEDGAVVKGTLTENADGTLTLTAGTTAIPAGEYGGTIDAVGGGVNVGGGVDASGELNVEAAAAAIADNSASAEPAASEEPASTTSTASIATVLIATSLSNEAPAAPAASGEPSGEEDNAQATIVIGGKEYKIDVYVIDGEEYVKLSDVSALLGGEEEASDGDVTWADYQEYLIEAAGGNAPNLDEFKGQVYAINSWDEMPLDESPWDQLFTTVGISTWADFQAGQANSSQVEGSMG